MTYHLSWSSRWGCWCKLCDSAERPSVTLKQSLLLKTCHNMSRALAYHQPLDSRRDWIDVLDIAQVQVQVGWMAGDTCWSAFSFSSFPWHHPNTQSTLNALSCLWTASPPHHLGNPVRSLFGKKGICSKSARYLSVLFQTEIPWGAIWGKDNGHPSPAPTTPQHRENVTSDNTSPS